MEQKEMTEPVNEKQARLIAHAGNCIGRFRNRREIFNATNVFTHICAKYDIADVPGIQGILDQFHDTFIGLDFTHYDAGEFSPEGLHVLASHLDSGRREVMLRHYNQGTEQ